MSLYLISKHISWINVSLIVHRPSQLSDIKNFWSNPHPLGHYLALLHILYYRKQILSLSFFETNPNIGFNLGFANYPAQWRRWNVRTYRCTNLLPYKSNPLSLSAASPIISFADWRCIHHLSKCIQRIVPFFSLLRHSNSSPSQTDNLKDNR